MGFGHEKLDVYRLAIEYVGWADHYGEGLKGHRNAQDISSAERNFRFSARSTQHGEEKEKTEL